MFTRKTRSFHIDAKGVNDENLLFYHISKHTINIGNVIVNVKMMLIYNVKKG